MWWHLREKHPDIFIEGCDLQRRVRVFSRHGIKIYLGF